MLSSSCSELQAAEVFATDDLGWYFGQWLCKRTKYHTQHHPHQQKRSGDEHRQRRWAGILSEFISPWWKRSLAFTDVLRFSCDTNLPNFVNWMQSVCSLDSMFISLSWFVFQTDQLPKWVLSAMRCLAHCKYHQGLCCLLLILQNPAQTMGRDFTEKRRIEGLIYQNLSWLLFISENIWNVMRILALLIPHIKVQILSKYCMLVAYRAHEDWRGLAGLPWLWEGRVQHRDGLFSRSQGTPVDLLHVWSLHKRFW